MKVNLSKEVKDHTFISHLILHCLSSTAMEDVFAGIMKKREDFSKDAVVDVKLLVDGNEMPFEDFCGHWQKQVSRMMKEKSIQLLDSKMLKVEDVLSDLTNRLTEEVTARLEDWEKEDGLV